MKSELLFLKGKSNYEFSSSDLLFFLKNIILYNLTNLAWVESNIFLN
jgi:hypothetical protein